VDLAGEIAAAGAEYTRRIQGGAGPEANQEIAATIRSKITEMGKVELLLRQLEAIGRLIPELLPHEMETGADVPQETEG
jgi:hypothetical protein